jgi:hypothetical protein
LYHNFRINQGAAACIKIDKILILYIMVLEVEIMSEAMNKEAPECPMANDNSHLVKVIIINDYNLHNLGFGKEITAKILEETAVFYKCSCGLYLRATKEGKIINLIKTETQ